MCSYLKIAKGLKATKFSIAKGYKLAGFINKKS
jgi:hypothetical protein